MNKRAGIYLRNRSRQRWRMLGLVLFEGNNRSMLVLPSIRIYIFMVIVINTNFIFCLHPLSRILQLPPLLHMQNLQQHAIRPTKPILVRILSSPTSKRRIHYIILL